MQNITSGKTSKAQMPLISFVIPDYNLPVTLLEECLDSIMALELDDSQREIILIDDGSDDSPLPMLDNYRDHFVYIRQANGGLSAARNRGIQLCSGRYIQFVDGDDKLIPSTYNKLLAYLREHGDTDMLLFHHSNKDKSGDAETVFGEPLSGTSFMRHNNLRASAWSYLFKRSILGNLRFTPRLLHEDEEFTPLLTIRAEKLVDTNAHAYFYRQREDSIISKSDDNHKTKRLDDMHHIILRLNSEAAHGAIEERTALGRRVNQLTMDYIYNIITLTRSEKQLKERVAQLREEGLFPLPPASYTRKYQLFSKLSASPTGLNMLLRSLPLLNRLKP